MPNLVKELSPVHAIETLLKVNPDAAKFLAGGTAVFAGAAVVLSHKFDIATMVQVGLYIVGFALLLAVVAKLPEFLRNTLGAAVVMAIIATIGLFFISAVTDWPKPIYCLINLREDCDKVQERLANDNAARLDAKVSVPTAIVAPPELLRPVLPTALPTPQPAGDIPAAQASAASAVAPATQPVYIQFAGLITRDSVKSLNAALRRGGWNVQSSSGERTEAAAGVNEVRYSKAQDLPAALALADAVTATKIASQPVTPRLVPMVGENLELWISN